MQHHNDIEHLLTKSIPTLSQSERSDLWNALSLKLESRPAIPSPFNFNFMYTHTRATISLVLILLLALGGGGTVFASNAARPGDLLFPIERALENTRLTLPQSDTSRNALRAQFSEERLKELKEIINEEAVPFTDAQQIAGDVAITGTTTDAEPREHKNKERRLDQKGEARVGVAVDAILTFLDDTHVDAVKRTQVLKEVFGEIDGLALDIEAYEDRVQTKNSDGRVHVRSSENGESNIEIQKGNERTHIDKKDGSVRVETEESTQQRNEDIDQDNDKNTTTEETTSADSDDSSEESLQPREGNDTNEEYEKNDSNQESASVIEGRDDSRKSHEDKEDSSEREQEED